VAIAHPDLLDDSSVNQNSDRLFCAIAWRISAVCIGKETLTVFNDLA
jgi:hypothetical protein